MQVKTSVPVKILVKKEIVAGLKRVAIYIIFREVQFFSVVLHPVLYIS